MKRKIFQSSILLLIGGFVTKLLGLMIRIIMNRNVGIDGVSLYMIVLPTFSLFIMLGQAGIPLSLSRLVALKNKNSKVLFSTTFIFLLFYNLILMIIIIIFARVISHSFLHNDDLYYPILMIAFVIPFTTLSSTLRSFFIGKERMFPSVLSNICENIVRLLFVLLIIKQLSFLPTNVVVSIIILFNIISEGFASFILYLFIPNKKDFSFSIQCSYMKEVVSLSVPNFMSNLLGNITYFLEPILFTSILLYKGYPSHFIMHEYGIINGYVFPIIMLPSFFINAISQAILPSLTREHSLKNY